MNNKYIIDTNIIINNPFFIKDLNNSEIIIPIHVLEELDKLKSFDGDKGFRARQFFRYFKKLEKELNGNLLEGIYITEDTILKIGMEQALDRLPNSFDDSYVDNKILSMMLLPIYDEYTLLTNDISMRFKASALGKKAKSMDSSDKHKLDDLYTGILEIDATDELVKEFYHRGEIEPAKLGIEEIFPNQYVVGTTGYSYLNIIGRYDAVKNTIVKLKNDDPNVYGIKPKDIRQKLAFDALLNPKIPFVTMTARQGCGKTFLALAVALNEVLQTKRYEKIVIGKNTSPIDKWSYQGFTTGDTEEKLLTHFGSYSTTFENIQNARGKKNKNGLEIINNLIAQEKLEVLDISSILGSSFINRIVIIDEAQSFDVHAMRSIITRIGENSKLILIGDVGQQTISRMDPDKSGLYAAVEWLKELKETAHITLKDVHRSKFVEDASKLFDEKLFG